MNGFPRLQHLLEAFWISCLVGTCVWMNAGCKRTSEPPAPSIGTTSTSTASSPLPSAGASSGGVAPTAGATTGATSFAGQAPETFDRGVSLSVENSGVTGCTARVVPGWAEIRCEPKNAEGGKLLGAYVTSGAAASAPVDLKPGADGVLRLVLPWLKGQRSQVRFEWVDMKQDLLLAVRGSRFTRILPEAQAAQCERLGNTSEQILASIREKIGPLSPAITPKDVYRFPDLGRCRMAGTSAWALGLTKLSASGSGANREVVATLSLNHIDASGEVSSTTYGPLTFAPEGLQLPELMTFDYDADGSAEVIVRQDVLLRPVRSMFTSLPRIPAVFTFEQGQVTPYPGLSPLAGGGIVAEQLEPDGRPDVGDYGPFLAWLPDDCGRGDCPKRITGPRFFLRSLLDGGFSAQDEQADTVIRNKCERTPKDLVVDVRTAAGKRQTAQNVACARVRGDDPQVIQAQLDELRSEMCDDGQKTCPFYTVMASWAKATPPRQVALPHAK